MLSSKPPFLRLLSTSTFVATTYAMSGRNPCHPAATKGLSSNCQVLTLPDGFCGACPFGPITQGGFYLDCTRTIDLERAPQTCFDLMNEYVLLNPYDSPRMSAFFDYMNSTDPSTIERARLTLDFFMYAFCEEGCDCIPQINADRNNPTISIDRGNCQAHAYHDICRQAPNIKLVRFEGSKNDDPATLPDVCPLLTQWIGNNTNWSDQSHTSVHPDVHYFLQRLLEAERLLENSAYWNVCFDLETAQGRIDEIMPHTTKVPVAASNIWIDKNENENYVGRHECSFVQAGDKFYMFGGREKPEQLDRYDYSSNTWSLGATAPHGFNHFQAVQHGGLIWIVAAFDRNGYPDESPAHNIWVYDPARDTWMPGPQIPSNRRRGSAGVVVYKDKFYVVGGNKSGHRNGFVPWVDRYDPVANQWSELPDAPRARDHFHAVLVEDKIFCVGGRMTDEMHISVFSNSIPEVDIYDIESSSWSTLSRSLPEPRAAPGIAYVEGNILIMGGESISQTEAYDRVDSLDPITGQFTQVASMNHRRHGTQAIQSGQGVYIAGGSPNRGAGNQLNMEVYNKDQPEGEASTPGVLSGPNTLVSIPQGSIATIVVQHVSGNTGVFVNTVMIRGPDAELFSFADSNTKHFLIPPSSTRKISVLGTGSKPNSEAWLEVQYSNVEVLIIYLGSAPSTPTATNAKPSATTVAAATATFPVRGSVGTVTEFILVNADTDQEFPEPMVNGFIFTQAIVSQSALNIRAKTINDENIYRVEFILDDTFVRQEKVAPYAIGGDRDGDYFPWSIPADGQHILTAIPEDATGAGGNGHSVIFFVDTSLSHATSVRRPSPRENLH